MKVFYQLVANTAIASITNYTVWFALTFFTYLQTQSVFATSIISGLFLVATALTGIWFGSLVDTYKKKSVMILSSVFSLATFALGFLLYVFSGESAFQSIESPVLWILMPLLLAGVIAGNIRNIALPTLVTVLVPEDRRDKANGMVGLASGIGFMITSVISGLLVGHSGLYWVLILATIMTLVTIAHLWFISVPENEVIHTDTHAEKVSLKTTFATVVAIPGLIALIFFTTFNNFLGGVFMSLMDAYGLSLVPVQIWGFIWGFLSLAFIVGGIVISKFGLGKNPLKAMFLANVTIWIVSSVFTLYPSIILLMIGMFIYLSVVPFIEAAEHTIIQKVVPANKQGRVFGFAQSIEQAASPFTAFAIGPLTEFVVIPFMTDGAGVELIGSWFGTGQNRAIALVFTITGIIGLCITLVAWSSKYYRQLSRQVTAKPSQK